MASLVVVGPLTDSIHAETPDQSRIRHSLVHAELSQGQFETSQLRATTGSNCLSVTHCRSLTRAKSMGGDIWIQRAVEKQRNAGLVQVQVAGSLEKRSLSVSLFGTQTHQIPFHFLTLSSRGTKHAEIMHCLLKNESSDKYSEQLLHIRFQRHKEGFYPFRSIKGGNRALQRHSWIHSNSEKHQCCLMKTGGNVHNVHSGPPRMLTVNTGNCSAGGLKTSLLFKSGPECTTPTLRFKTRNGGMTKQSRGG